MFSSASCPNFTRLMSFRNSDWPYFSLIRRWRLPPRFARGLSSGGGRVFFWRAGGGSWALASDWSIFSRSCVPTCPRGDSWKESTLAARPHFPATSLTARLRNSRGVLRIRSLTMMIPCVWYDDDAMPSSAFFCEPTSMMFCAGIRARFSRPPAAVMSLAARAAPSSADRFGARPDMRLSRYRSTSRLQSFSRNASSQATIILSSSCRGSMVPAVIDAVTVMAMTAVFGRMSEKSMVVRSLVLPMRCTTWR
mmetsp:Transcript_107111/g.302809  ORF Transcript_107111/g.302809 Transcript_107111/m.302809 type:complete len:251 (-) Transcript_107111:501-1253(-)